MAHGLAAVVVVGDADHGDGGHDQGGNVRALQRVAHGQGVHHGGQHAHVVAGHAVHAGSAQRRTTEQVAAADHQADLHADTDELADFQRHAIEDFRIDAELLGAHQGLTAEFEQNAFVARLAATHLLSHCVSLLRRYVNSRASRPDVLASPGTAHSAAGAQRPGLPRKPPRIGSPV
ncbi:hypothetical protein D3C81_1474810 [compost metagenome]